jgi:hypothetical protein
MSRQCFEYHPATAYRFIPGLKARIPHESGGYLVRANGDGFRCDHEFTRARTPGLRRVLIFGDSFTAGDGVSNGYRYSDALESLLPNTEVYNYGLPGSGTDQQFLAWKEFAQETEHDVLVIAVLVENIRRIAARFRRYQDDQGKEVVYAKPYFTLTSGALALHHSPPERLPIDELKLPPEEQQAVDRGGRFESLRKLIRRFGLQEVVQRVTGYQPVPEYGSARNADWLLMRAILTAWVTEHAKTCKKPVVIMPLPLYQHVDGTSSATAYQRRFSELGAELGCTIHDPLPDLRKYSSIERRAFRFPIDIHPSREGHLAFAKSLAPTIMRLLPALAHGS